MSKDELIQAIESMSVLELSELVKALEEKFGVSASAAPVAMMAMPGAAAAAAPAEEKTEFDVVYKDAKSQALDLKRLKNSLTIRRRISKKACQKKRLRRFAKNSLRPALKSKLSNLKINWRLMIFAKRAAFL